MESSDLDGAAEIMYSYTTKAQDARRQARRIRARRQSQGLMGEDPVFEEQLASTERDALRDLRKASFTGEFDNFSDDESSKPKESIYDFARLWEAE